MIKVRRKVHLVRRGHGRQVVVDAEPHATTVPPGRIPRVSRLMAFAIHFDRLIREGKVADQSELARLAHVTQPRMTQIMNLNHLAPDIQEELLLLPRVTTGRDPIHEKRLRSIVAEIDWRRQRRLWEHVSRTGRRQAMESPPKDGAAGVCRRLLTHRFVGPILVQRKPP